MTQFCTSCGTEVPTDATYCGECGTEIQSQDPEPAQPNSDGETAACQKCDSQIPVEAMKCPQCGYEPSKNGIGRWLLGILALPTFIFTGIITVAIPIVTIAEGGLPIASVFIGLVLFGSFAGGSGFALYGIYKAQDWKPTEEAAFEIGTDI